MEINQQNPHYSCNTTTSLTQPFAKRWSLKDPQSYPWWRKTSAIKTPQTSTETSEKNPYLTPNLKPNENSEKNPFLTMENTSGFVNIKENIDGFNPKSGFFSYENMKRKTHFLSMEVNDFSKPKSKYKSLDKIMKTHDFVQENDEKRLWVMEALEMFRAKCDEISKSCVNVRRIDCKALEELKKQRLICCSSSKILGNVPGVKIGDKFKYRVEIYIIGLHGRTQHGIDYMTYNGSCVATCVVAREGHLDKMNDCNVITYVGEGGVVKTNQGDVYEDQKLVRGNKALRNSMLEKTSVRVVRGVGCINGDRITYVYDGLYKVVSYEQKKVFTPNMVFEFKLERCPGQPVVPWHKFRNAL